MVLSDDVVVTPFRANALLHFYLARERELNGRPLVMEHRFNVTIGTVFGMYYAYFPVMSGKTVDTIAGYYSEEYPSPLESGNRTTVIANWINAFGHSGWWPRLT